MFFFLSLKLIYRCISIPAFLCSFAVFGKKVGYKKGFRFFSIALLKSKDDMHVHLMWGSGQLPTGRLEPNTLFTVLGVAVLLRWRMVTHEESRPLLSRGALQGSPEADSCLGPNSHGENP